MPNTSLWQVEHVGFDTFYSSFKTLRNKHSRPDTVLLRDEKFYNENCRDYLAIYDATKVVATAAITNDGEVISVLGDEDYHKVSKNLLTAALVFNGLKLDCYNVRRLWINYNYAGFRPVASYTLNKDEIKEVKDWWDIEEDGDDFKIIYWIYDRNCKSPLNATYPDLEKQKNLVKAFTSKEKAEAYRDSIAFEHFRKMALVK